MNDTVDVRSEYIPDTTLHPLNGSFVVAVRPAQVCWLTPDAADALAERLRVCADLARSGVDSFDAEWSQNRDAM